MKILQSYKEMWQELMDFKIGYDILHNRLIDKIMFWLVVVKVYIMVTVSRCFYFLFGRGWSFIITNYYRLKFHICKYSPWSRAVVCLCWTKYVESEWYRERLVLMGEKFAVEQFVNGDWKFFKRKITRKEKLGMLVYPYTYIEKNRPWITCDMEEMK